MIKITDTKGVLTGFNSIKKFDCPNCKTEMTFRISTQASCYKCGKPLVDVASLLKVLTTRVLYHNNRLK